MCLECRDQTAGLGLSRAACRPVPGPLWPYVRWHRVRAGSVQPVERGCSKAGRGRALSPGPLTRLGPGDRLGLEAVSLDFGYLGQSERGRVFYGVEQG